MLRQATIYAAQNLLLVFVWPLQHNHNLFDCVLRLLHIGSRQVDSAGRSLDGQMLTCLHAQVH